MSKEFLFSEKPGAVVLTNARCKVGGVCRSACVLLAEATETLSV